MPDDDRLSYELDLCLQEQLWQHLLEDYCCYFSTADLLLSMHKNLNNIDCFKKFWQILYLVKTSGSTVTDKVLTKIWEFAGGEL